MKLSIITPIHNESKTITATIRKIHSVILPPGISKEIIIIDDGSTDGTARILTEYSNDPTIKIFHYFRSKGKGWAVRLGLEKITGDIILIQDGDLEYSPLDYPKLIAPIINQGAYIVYGSRFKGRIKNMSFVNKIANVLSNITLNLLYNTKISDVNTCYKVFKKEVLEDIAITSCGFQFDTEITAKLLNRGYKIYEVPIDYEARLKAEGKKMDWIKAIVMYLGIIKFRFIKDAR